MQYFYWVLSQYLLPCLVLCTKNLPEKSACPIRQRNFSKLALLKFYLVIDKISITYFIKTKWQR